MSVHFSRLFDNNFDTVEPKYKPVRSTLKKTCNNPQIWEVECDDGLVLYIRFNGNELSCKEKWNGQLVCFGVPILDQQQEISNDRLEFLLEMYSKHLINFI